MCAMASEDSLFKLHKALCHPGITRLNHFVRTKTYLIPSMRLRRCQAGALFVVNVDLSSIAQRRFPSSKPLSHSRGSTSTSKVLFQRITETGTSSWLLMSTPGSHLFSHVLMCLLVGMPAYVHSDRGASFMSNSYANSCPQRE